MDWTKQGDEVLHVRFKKKEIKDVFKSNESGRPIFKTIEVITIKAPGSLDTIERPATDQDKRRFSRHYKVFQADPEYLEKFDIIGTPLTEASFIENSLAENLKYDSVFTVEQLASISDDAIQKISGITYQLRDDAKAYLRQGEAISDLEKSNKEIKELKKEIKKLQDDIKNKDKEIGKLSKKKTKKK